MVFVIFCNECQEPEACSVALRTLEDPGIYTYNLPETPGADLLSMLCLTLSFTYSYFSILNSELLGLLKCYYKSVKLLAILWSQSTLLYPWNSPGKNTGVGCHSFSRGSS